MSQPANGLDLAKLLGKMSPEKQQMFQQLAGQLTNGKSGGM